jgi:23S rRNA pseudouridine2457 synthase
MSRLIAFNKPFGVLTQFSGKRRTLQDYIDVRGVYPAGRLDRDSEGLVLLTDDGKLQARIASPKFKLPKTYVVQVERIPSDGALDRLRRGLELDDGITRPAKARLIHQPEWLWPRDPPIRYRKSVPDCWLELVITEGRNRQVRRMTAAVGHPTLRLIRYAIGAWTIDGLQPGQWRELQSHAQHGRERQGRGGTRQRDQVVVERQSGCAKNARVSLAIRPDNSSRPTRFGNAIRPFIMSENVQTSSSSVTAPTKITSTKTTR